MAHIYHISQIGSLAGRTICFDANVLIHNYWPTGRNQMEQAYSRAYSQLLRQGNRLAVSLMVISEVINRVLRIEYDNHLRDTRKDRKSLSFKSFRDSPEGQSVVADVYQIVRDDILPRFTVADTLCGNVQVAALLQPDTLDFNDAYLAALC